MHPLDTFLDRCCLEIERRAALHASDSPALVTGAQAFRHALTAATPVEVEARSQPVVDELRDLAGQPLVDALLPVLDSADSFPWVSYPPLGDDGSQVALGRINHVRDFGEINCGLMLIGAGCTFPLHNHPPQELYLPLTESGEWRVGGSTEFRPYGSDELPYNHPHDTHSVRAGDEPLLAMFVLWP